jgi:light-regulated signal transduction histidine kinase (bacteriophytochrome)
VLENLLDNAVKFTTRSDEPIVEFGANRVGGQLVYFVRDNGVGFNMDYSKRLFGAFQRLHSPSDFPGTGVGLASVQRVIHRHGGRVWAEAAEGRGATFFWTLPEPSVS